MGVKGSVGILLLGVSAACIGAGIFASVGFAQPEPTRNVDANGVYEVHPVEIAPHSGVSVSAISIRNSFGHVQVRGHDGPNLRIRAVKRAPDEKTLDRLRVKLVPDPANGSMQIRTALSPGNNAAPIAKGSIRIDLVIEAPRKAKINAHLRKGLLTVSDMDNGASLKADLGDIEVQNCSGLVRTSTVRGKQNLREVFGTVDAHGLVGDLALRMIHGQSLSAMVHRGSVTGRGIRSKHVSIRTTVGNIVIAGEAQTGGTYQLATHTGDIKLRFRSSSKLAVTARSPRRISLPTSLHAVEVSPGVFAGTTPAPIATVSLGAQNGDVRVAWGWR